MELVPCFLARLAIDERQDRHLVRLQAVGDERHLDLIIGPFEAQAIERALHKKPFARPLTHDLLRSVLNAHNARISAVRIVREDNGTYFAELELIRADDERINIDCRPSDSLALWAHSSEVPLLIAPELLTPTRA